MICYSKTINLCTACPFFVVVVVESCVVEIFFLMQNMRLGSLKVGRHRDWSQNCTAQKWTFFFWDFFDHFYQVAETLTPSNVIRVRTAQ